ncbi:hypothetical protein SAMN02744037_01852 [Tepidibacter formicigenes DSM 15518]|uniref:Uncharacterized protein n=2 Tax=Tepidibacter TaxID=214904 RepID=A0A1M6QI06_9FIRM|nr:hypothetical protein SAMN02744037_01852 [Tepidibacter formicigenes DSM 15518]
MFLAKKLLVDSIYNSARMEDCNIEFADVQTMIDDVSVADLKIEDVEGVLGIRDAWKYVLNSINDLLNLEYICRINSLISRNENGILGASQKDKRNEKLDSILLNNSSATEKAIELFLWSCRYKLFDSYNKSTGLIIANKLLISEGKGLLIIKEKNLKKFNKLLVESYKSKNCSEISNFLHKKCIYGLEIDRKLKQKYKENKFE